MEERAYSVITDDELQQFISLYEKQFHILKMVMTAYLKEESQRAKHPFSYQTISLADGFCDSLCRPLS